MGQAKWYGAAVTSHIFGGVRKYLVIDTRSTDPRYMNNPLQMKFCGGTEENHSEDKSVLDSLYRELTEETGMVYRPSIAPVMIDSTVLQNGHIKNFYDVNFSDLEGSLRTEEVIIEGDWMSAPYWVTYEEARRSLCGTHQGALQKSHNRYLARKAA
ncbi:hypothetical protein BH11PAT3_BH11PAT3_0420 [soil metagenome]